MKKKMAETQPGEVQANSGGPNVRVALLQGNFHREHGDPRNPEERNFSKVMERIEGDVKWLMSLIIEDDALALKTLVEMGIYTASCVQLVVQHLPDLARQVAEVRTEWPINITQNPKHPVDPDEIRKTLNLERKSPRPFRVDSVEVLESPSIPHQLVYSALVAIDEMRKAFQFVDLFKLTSTYAKADRVTSIGANPAPPHEPIQAFFRGKQLEAQKRYDAARHTMLGALQRLDHILGIDQQLPPPDLRNVTEMASKLEERNAKNGEQWLQAVCDLVLCVVGGKHSGNPVLATLGASGKKKFRKSLLKTREKKEVDRVINSGEMKDSEDHFVWEQVARKLETAFNAMSPDYAELSGNGSNST